MKEWQSRPGFVPIPQMKYDTLMRLIWAICLAEQLLIYVAVRIERKKCVKFRAEAEEFLCQAKLAKYEVKMLHSSLLETLETKKSVFNPPPTPPSPS